MIRFIFVYFASTCCLQAEEVPETITRLVARPSEIDTGIFEIKIQSKILNPKTGESVEPQHIQEFTVAIDGDDWAKRYPNFRHFAVNGSELAASYYEIRKGEILANQRLTLTRPREPLQSLAEKEVWAKWRLIGAIPRLSIAKYISKTLPTAHSRTVIDGVRCLVYEYEIKQDQLFEVLTGVHHTMLNAESVTLRLSLAEDFGFALARSEVLGPLGSYDVTTSHDFVEVAENIFLPLKWKHFYGPSKGVERSAVDEIELKHFKFVNHPLPDDTFSFNIPAGTSVTDERPKRSRQQYYLPEEVSLSQFLIEIDSE
ncbi:hypothetical protein OAF98_06075 [Planctomicrobium sp.]|nr:hypothetical protein [Planctomicrobium sp.]MDB4744037.1 hypothetical protein [Planctomicrobium sp.]